MPPLPPSVEVTSPVTETDRIGIGETFTLFNEVANAPRPAQSANDSSIDHRVSEGNERLPTY